MGVGLVAWQFDKHALSATIHLDAYQLPLMFCSLCTQTLRDLLQKQKDDSTAAIEEEQQLNQVLDAKNGQLLETIRELRHDIKKQKTEFHEKMAKADAEWHINTRTSADAQAWIDKKVRCPGSGTGGAGQV
jgi:hypothetical protein